MTRVVKFVKPFSVYAVGDVAGLTELEAREAIFVEAAVPYTEVKEVKEPEKETEKKKEEEKKVETVEAKSVDSPIVDKMEKNAPVKK